jgi:hypothetical protein
MRDRFELFDRLVQNLTNRADARIVVLVSECGQALKARERSADSIFQRESAANH